MAIEIKELIIRGFLGLKPTDEAKEETNNCTTTEKDNQLKAQLDQLKNMVEDKNER